MSLLDAILDDDGYRTTDALSAMPGPNCAIDLGCECKVPTILRKALWGSLTAFVGAFQAFMAFVNLGFNLLDRDVHGRVAAHYACISGDSGILRQIDQMGQDWTVSDNLRMTPAEYASQMGHIAVLQWLWTKGGLLLEPRKG